MTGVKQDSRSESRGTSPADGLVCAGSPNSEECGTPAVYMCFRVPEARRSVRWRERVRMTRARGVARGRVRGAAWACARSRARAGRCGAARSAQRAPVRSAPVRSVSLRSLAVRSASARGQTADQDDDRAGSSSCTGWFVARGLPLLPPRATAAPDRDCAAACADTAFPAIRQPRSSRRTGMCGWNSRSAPSGHVRRGGVPVLADHQDVERALGRWPRWVDVRPSQLMRRPVGAVLERTSHSRRPLDRRRRGHRGHCCHDAPQSAGVARSAIAREVAAGDARVPNVPSYDVPSREAQKASATSAGANRTSSDALQAGGHPAGEPPGAEPSSVGGVAEQREGRRRRPGRAGRRRRGRGRPR